MSKSDSQCAAFFGKTCLKANVWQLSRLSNVEVNFVPFAASYIYIYCSSCSEGEGRATAGASCTVVENRSWPVDSMGAGCKLASCCRRLLTISQDHGKIEYITKVRFIRLKVKKYVTRKPVHGSTSPLKGNWKPREGFLGECERTRRDNRSFHNDGGS